MVLFFWGLLADLSTVIFTTKNALWERSHVDNSFRYIFIYHFSYLLTYYYSFLAHYNKKCFDINWFHLLSSTILPLWYFCFEVTWLLRDDSNSKTRVRVVYVLPEVLHGDFLSEIKYLFNLEGNILHILTRNVIFFYDYSNWGELSFNIFKFFMYTNRTRVLLLKSSLKSHVTSKREYHKDKMAGLSRWNQSISKHFLL
jgi:hypothetical protein